MSQNDFTIANQGFPAFRADLNSALQALATNSSGGSAPSTTFANMWWYDTSNNIMYIRNEDNDAWIKFAELDQTNDKFVLSGTLQLDDGTVSAPALTFNSDTNMGIYRGGTDILKFVTAGTDAITINASQQVGIGTSPNAKLDIKDDSNSTQAILRGRSSDNFGILDFRNNAGDTVKGQIKSDASSNLIFRAGSTTDAIYITNSGNVGIGNSSPTVKLDIVDDGVQLRLANSTTGTTTADGSRIQLSGNDLLLVNRESANMQFYTADTERMRIDSSGNLLVRGTETVVYADTSGNQLEYGSYFAVKRETANASQAVAYFNNTGADGNIIDFRKDGSTVGSIGVNASQITIGNGTTGLRFHGTNGIIYPWNITSNAARDNAIDLGSAGVRFDDIYATNGTIQTSDQNEKNTITDSDLGIDFIKRLTPKSYIFNGKTRTHYGLIAQDVETVLGDISKPTSGFAGFIKSDISEEQDGSEYRYGLRYTEFVAPLIQAVKDQQATIDALTARITALENGE